MFSQSEHMIFLVRCPWVYMFQNYGCITMTPKRNGLEQPCIARGSTGQEFGRAECGGLLCLLATSGSQLEALEAGGGGLPKAHRFTRLVVDADCWLRGSVSCVVSSFELVWASSLRGGWIPTVNTEQVGEGRQREEGAPSGRCHLVTQPRKGHSITCPILQCPEQS